jgi:hypothetical protein
MFCDWTFCHWTFNILANLLNPRPYIARPLVAGRVVGEPFKGIVQP